MALNRKLRPLLNLYKKNRAELDALTLADAAAWFNESQTEYRRVPMSEVHDWATAKRLVKRFQEADPAVPELYEELQMLIQGKQESVNFQSAEAQGIVQDMVTAGILTVDEATELQSMALVNRTRAAQVGINRTVTTDWIERIREVL